MGGTTVSVSSKFCLLIPHTGLTPQGLTNGCGSIMATPGSDIWSCFAISAVENSKALCKICSESVLRGGTSSRTYNNSNLRKHL